MILISGTSSGLGRYLMRHFNAAAFDRARAFSAYREQHFDAIIHCAFNSQRDVGIADSFQYVSDNVFLTQRLASLNYGKFIYISTVDVYPRDGAPHSESSEIFLSQQDSAYGTAKVISEGIVRGMAPNHLVLRPTGMVGEHIRPTTLTRLILEDRPTLSLTADSVLNFIHHTDVATFIEVALKSDLSGTYNLASDINATLGDIAAVLGAQPYFGTHFYDIGLTQVARASAILPAFGKSTIDVVTAFARALGRSL